jgi:PHD/YefM family antitoxin component YafN of YafNO toxin-antitoxin module
MTRVTLAEASANFEKLAASVGASGEPILVSRGRGRKALALVPAALLAAIEDEADARDFRAARAKARREKSVAWPDLKADLGL